MSLFPQRFDAAPAIGYPVRWEALMRKTAVLVLLVLILSATSGAALDINLGAGYRYQFSFITDFTAYNHATQEHTLSLDLRAWPYPLQLGIGFSRVFTTSPSDEPVSFGNAVLTADYWIVDLPLGSSPLSMHIGAGVWASIPMFGVGVRTPVGLRWTPIGADKGFEVSVELVPAFGAWLAPWTVFSYGASAGLGVRYWFGRGEK
jgi:hypothetical protein